MKSLQAGDFSFHILPFPPALCPCSRPPFFFSLAFFPLSASHLSLYLQLVRMNYKKITKGFNWWWNFACDQISSTNEKNLVHTTFANCGTIWDGFLTERSIAVRILQSCGKRVNQRLRVGLWYEFHIISSTLPFLFLSYLASLTPLSISFIEIQLCITSTNIKSNT